MAESLKAFENLRENVKNSLSSQEKADLRKISPDDIKSQREKVGDKSFVVGGKSMKLKDIVKNLTFDEEGEKAELKINGKKVAIGWQSELGAAIQVYAIAHNKTIGRAGIDGKVGRDTVRGLQSTQNAVRANKRETTPESREQVSWVDLVNKPFGKYIKIPDRNIPLLEKRGIMNPQTGCLTPTNRLTYLQDKKLKFDYKFDGATLKVEVPVKEDKYHQIDPKQVADDIIKATINRQNEHKIEKKNQTVEDGINNFEEGNITDPLIKKWANVAKIDFACAPYNNGRIMVFDRNKKKIANETRAGGFMLNNTDLLENGVFSEKKFNAIISKKCHAEAINGVKGYVSNTINSYGLASDLKDTRTINNKIMNCNFLVDEIKALKNDEELKASKASIENKRKSFENQKNYLSAKEDLNQAIKNVENLMKKSGSVADFDKQFELALTEIKKCVGVKRITDSEYNLNYRTVMRGKFWAVGKKSEYNDMITRLISPISKRLVKFNHIDRD